MSNTITLEEYKQFTTMFNATNDDLEIAVSNLNNLDVPVLYKVLVVKGAKLELRKKVYDLCTFFDDHKLAECTKNMTNTYGFSRSTIDLSFETIYDLIKQEDTPDEKLQKFFEDVFEFESSKTILDGLNCKFLDKINIKIKW